MQDTVHIRNVGQVFRIVATDKCYCSSKNVYGLIEPLKIYRPQYISTLAYLLECITQ
jgi:hypothetical protein